MNNKYSVIAKIDIFRILLNIENLNTQGKYKYKW